MRAGLASRNSDEGGRKRKSSQQAANERASSSTKTQAQAGTDRKRRSEGDDRYDPSRDVDVGEVAAQEKVSTQQRNQCLRMQEP